MNDSTNPAGKRCSKCKEVKPLEMFSKGNGKDGLQKTCKSCVSAYNRANKEKINEQKRSYREGLKDREHIVIPKDRLCPKCKIVKPASEYFSSSTTVNGLVSHCKACCRAHEIAVKEKSDTRRKSKAEERKSREVIVKPAAKRCPKCNTVKPSTDFATSRVTLNGLTSHCKSCLAEYRELNRGKSRDYFRERIRANPEENRRKMSEWVKKNPDKVTVQRHKRRDRLAGNGGSFTDKDIANMRAIQQGHCCYCGRLGQHLHLEHIIPITQGGPSDSWNLALACQKCNSSKSNRTLEQWVNRWYY